MFKIILINIFTNNCQTRSIKNIKSVNEYIFIPGDLNKGRFRRFFVQEIEFQLICVHDCNNLPPFGYPTANNTPMG
jgi:hypothetical protein